jgi:hypothetical protein
MAPSLLIYRGDIDLLKIGHNITIHKTMAPDPIMNGNAAAGDKLAGHTLLILTNFN